MLPLFALILLCLHPKVASLYVWRNLTSAEYREWYTEQEIAYLEDKNRRDGNPLSHYCSDPRLSIHPHFKMGLEGYSNKSKNMLKPLLDRLWSIKSNITLCFVGDSLMTNRAHFFIQDIKRIQVDFKEETSRLGNFDLITHPAHQKIVLQTSKLTLNRFNETTGVYYSNAAEDIDYVNLVEKRDALILVTMGAWFNIQRDYMSQMAPVVSWLQSLAQRAEVKNKVVWLTGIPQHWESENGYWYGGKGPGVNGNEGENMCRPIVDTDPKKDWRNEMVRQHLRNISDQYIEIFDDRDIYLPLHDHHSGNRDCTHYCYHPIYQQPLYEHMLRWLKHFD